MIVFDNVTKYYGDNIGVQNINVTIAQGDFVFLVGPSGAGKSTFIKLILKEIEADEGYLYFDNYEVTSLSNRMVPKLRRKIGIVFQDFRLLPNKTVYENVAFAMEVVHASNRKIKERVNQILGLVGISDKKKSFPNELSAGEQQRVAIARALVNRPDVLIADEPTGNLDPDTAWEIMKLLDLINQQGTTIVMVTHAKDIVDRMGKRVIAITGGQIIRDDASGAYGDEDADPKPSKVFDPDDDDKSDEDIIEPESYIHSDAYSEKMFKAVFKNQENLTAEERVALRRQKKADEKPRFEKKNHGHSRSGRKNAVEIKPVDSEGTSTRKTVEIRLKSTNSAIAEMEMNKIKSEAGAGNSSEDISGGSEKGGGDRV